MPNYLSLPGRRWGVEPPGRFQRAEPEYEWRKNEENLHCGSGSI